MTANGERDSISDVVLTVEGLLKGALGDVYLMSQSLEACDRYRALSEKVINIKKLLQPFEMLVGLGASEVLLSAATAPQLAPAAQKPQKSVPEEGDSSTGRRAKSTAFDLMVLEVIGQGAHVQRPVGLEQVFQAANYLVPGTQRNSLTAKLNRWKNEAGYLNWTDSNDMRLTEAGIAHKVKLLRLAKNDPKLAQVPDAIFHAIGVRPSYG